jgi:hypothetical protein
MTSLQEKAAQIYAIKKLEELHSKERESLYAFINHYWAKEKRSGMDDNRHIRLICDKLEKVYTGEIKRLIINIPPRSLKTEIVSKAFPVWCLGHDPRLKFMLISYSAELAEKNN